MYAQTGRVKIHLYLQRLYRSFSFRYYLVDTMTTIEDIWKNIFSYSICWLLGCKRHIYAYIYTK